MFIKGGGGRKSSAPLYATRRGVHKNIYIYIYIFFTLRVNTKLMRVDGSIMVLIFRLIYNRIFLHNILYIIL